MNSSRRLHGARSSGRSQQEFDAPTPNAGFPFMFAATYLNTMTEHHKLTPNDITAMVVVRHMGIGMVLTDPVWKKYGRRG